TACLMVGSYFQITCSPTAGLVAKSGQRTVLAHQPFALSLAHGLLNGWVVLPDNVLPNRRPSG
ncbi:hypothetical protein, partial [Limosilactobacillus fermentum]